MKRFFAYLLTGIMLLSLTACGEKAPGGETTPTAPEPVDALSQFRGQMKPPVMAVADFGFPDLSEDYDVMDFLWDEYPKWMETHDFVANIPQERIVRTCDFDYWAQVVCIVPQDPAATVCVNVTSYTDEMCNEVLDTYVAYHSESGEPILLLATTAESVSVSVVITDSEGRGVSWEPYWEIVEPIPEDGYNGHLVMYFTPTPEKTPYERAVQNGWYVPELWELAGTEWKSQLCDYAMDLNEDAVPGDNGGWVAIYDVDEIGAYTQSYAGAWDYADGMLHLSLVPEFEDGVFVDASFPVLMHDGILWIGTNADGMGLPHFYAGQPEDTLEQPKG